MPTTASVQPQAAMPWPTVAIRAVTTMQATLKPTKNGLRAPV